MLSNYSLDEVRALVEHYDALNHKREQLWLLVRFADLDKALRRLPGREREVLVLHGIYGLSTRQTATQLGIHHSTVGRAYLRGTARLTRIINGQTPTL